jgi:hypothetical protein
MYTTAAMSIINPLAHWSLGSITEQKTNDSAYNASLTNVSYSSTPIINNDESDSKSLLIKSNSVVDIKVPSGNLNDMFQIFDRGWSVAFWFNFNNQLTGSGYGTTPYQDNKLKLLQINSDYDGSQLGLIYYDYLTNTIRFNLTELSTTNNTDAYAVLTQFDRNYLIVAEYIPPLNLGDQYGSINIYINGKTNNKGSGKIYVNNTKLFSLINVNVKLKIDGSSLFNTVGKPNSFIFTSLSICGLLSFWTDVKRSTDGSNQPFNYMYKSAFINGEPKNMSRLNASTSYFDFNSYDIKQTTISKATISGENFTDKTSGEYKSRLIESSKYGIKNIYINPDDNFAYIFSESDVQSDYSNYTINSSSGIKLSTSSTQNLWWNINENIISDISRPNINILKNGEILGTTISMQITKGSASSENIFGLRSIYPAYNQSTYHNLYLKYFFETTTSSWHYTLYLFDTDYNSETILIDQIFSASSASANIALSVSDTELTLYTSEGGTDTLDLENGVIPISSESFLMSIAGNGLISTSRYYYAESTDVNNFTGYIKNVGISPIYNSDFSSYDFTELKFLMTRFTSTTKNRSTGEILFPPSIKGTFIKTIGSHLTDLNCYIIGNQINWNTMDNCTVSISNDGGNSYSTIKRFQPITTYDLYDMTKTFIIKVDIFDDPVVIDSNKQYFNNLSYYMFKDLGMKSDVANFTIESSSLKLLSNYTVMDYDETSSVYSRPANFGIKFTGDSIKPQGSALIKNPSASYYNVVEMWYRPDSLYTSVSNYLLNNVSGSSASPAIWVDSTGKFKSLGGKLYINGASYTDGTFTASSNEMYHLALLLNSSASNNLYLNGENLGVSASRGIATYGHLQFWHYAPTELELLNRFDSYFYLSTSSFFDTPRTPKPYRTSSPERYSIQIIK